MSDTKQQTNFTIGRLAAAAGVNIETVRYYQRIGLIVEPNKPSQGFRQYPNETLEQIKFIKRAQQLGFSLHEIADLLELGEGSCDDVRLQAEKKRDKIEKQIKDLQALKKTLTKLIDECHAGKSNQKCPIVKALLEK